MATAKLSAVAGVSEQVTCGAAELLSSKNGLMHSGAGQVHLLAAKSSVACKDARVGRQRLCVRAGNSKIQRGKKVSDTTEYPWPDKATPGSGDSLSFLSRFKPLPNPPKPVTLPFERPLLELARKIDEVRELANKTGMDMSEQITELEERYDQIIRDLYSQLTPYQRLVAARHPNRPTFLDHVINMADKWVELHGDRAGYDDPAIVCGIGKIEDMSFMLIGHQKGRNTKENIHRNFAMPTPHGYRKALRFMKHADHHGFPILTFIDTPGADPSLVSEEKGQGVAIAENLREMFGLGVPIITSVIGEGGSGGALAIGCGNKMLMLENAVYYVASPEACGAILYKTADAAPKAAEALRITSHDLLELDVVDEVIPEPPGGAHADPLTTSKNLKTVIMKHMRELLKKDPETLKKERVEKYLKIGAFEEGNELDPYIKRNMKDSESFDDSSERRPVTYGVEQILEESVPLRLSVGGDEVDSYIKLNMKEADALLEERPTVNEVITGVEQVTNGPASFGSSPVHTSDATLSIS